MNQLLLPDLSRTDGTAHDFLQKLNIDIPIVLVSRVEDLKLNKEILKLKEWVLIDYTELGWDWEMDYGHHFGVNTDKFPEVFRSEDWKIFDDFVRDTPPLMTFCRELLQKDVTDKLVPIVYPCVIPPVPIQTKEEFNRRTLNVFNTWGLSNEARKWLHAKIWKKSSNYGYAVCDNIFYLKAFLQNEDNPNKWFTANIPHYCRIPISEIMMLNGISKVSISIAGAGRNCFRHAESPVNSVMLMWDDELAWHKEDWIDGENCIKCGEGEEIQAAVRALNNPDLLYLMYRNGVATIDKFRTENYLRYIETTIKNA